MKGATLLSIGCCAATAAAASNVRGQHQRVHKKVVFKEQAERALSGSGDISFDDDMWAWDQGDMETVWDDYSMEPKKCMIYKGKHVIAYELYGKGNNQCAKKSEGTYLVDVGTFATAYTAQKQVDYALLGNDYGGADALDYTSCTAVQYNDVYYYAQLGCSSQGGLKMYVYSDESCTQESNSNAGLYNDVKIQFNACQSCVSWPAEQGDDDAAAQVDLDDNFYSYHEYDSKLCGAVDQAASKESCGWGCRKAVKKGESNSYNIKKSWNGFEKFFLFFWSFAAIGLVWVVLKQRRMMSREDAIVEEAAMNGMGLKKRHVFPIALGVIFFVLLAMFMVWKKLTWLILIGANVGLFAHFVFLRRKAKKASGGGEGYIKDAGLEIS